MIRINNSLENLWRLRKMLVLKVIVYRMNNKTTTLIYRERSLLQKSFKETNPLDILNYQPKPVRRGSGSRGVQERRDFRGKCRDTLFIVVLKQLFHISLQPKSIYLLHLFLKCKWWRLNNNNVLEETARSKLNLLRNKRWRVKFCCPESLP